MEYENQHGNGEDFDRDMEDGEEEEYAHNDSENIDDLLEDF